MPTLKILETNKGLQVTGLRKSYRKRIIIHDISLELKRGEVVALLGPNGSGKTTTFYSIAGLTSSDGGQVKIDGTDVTTMPMYRRARMGLSYLPQETSIFRGLNVEDNLKSVLDISTPLKSEQQQNFYLNCPVALLKNFEFIMSIKMSGKVAIFKGF